MATPKRLDFSSPSSGDGDDDSDDNIAPLSLSRRKFLRNPASKRAASDAVVEEEPKKKKKKKKKKLASSVINRIWNEDDELAILKGLVEYRSKKELEPSTDWDAFFHFIQGSIHVKVSKEQLLSKIRKLKRKFRVNTERINQGKDPLFIRSTDSEAFGVSMMIWGQNEAECANGGMNNAQQSESGEEMLKEGDEENGNAEHVNENGAAKTNADGESLDELVVDKITENKPAGKESHDNGAVKSSFDGKSLDEPVVDKITENKTAGKESHDNEAAKSNFDGNSLQELVDKITENMTFGKESHDNEAAKTNADFKSLDELVADKRTENKTAGKESHDNEATKSNFDGKSLQELVVDKRTENKTAGKESYDDELCAVRDAFEAMMLQGLSDYQKKLQLKKLMNLETEKRKELSNEWKALCAEERKLNIKKLRFSAKLVEAAIDG